MKEIIQKIINKLFCNHKWILFKEVLVDNTNGGDGSIYRVWHLYCEKCGKFKKIKSN